MKFLRYNGRVLLMRDNPRSHHYKRNERVELAGPLGNRVGGYESAYIVSGPHWMSPGLNSPDYYVVRYTRYASGPGKVVTDNVIIPEDEIRKRQRK